MATVEDVPPSAQPSQGNEVVRYQHWPRETRSQMERASNGDLQARLEMIDIQALARRPCKHQPDRSILSYLRDPGEGVALHEAAEIVLSELADQTEETALDSAAVFRYIQTHEVWKGHYGSAEELVLSLENRDYIQANILIGTSAQAAKRNYIRAIDAEWGAGWSDKIPQEMRPVPNTGPEGWSKRILINMGANAKHLTLERAIEGWQEEVTRRNDPGTRRRLGTRTKVTPCLVASDIASLNKLDHDDRRRRTSDVLFPDNEDRLRVELVPPQSKEKNIFLKLSLTGSTPSEPKAKTTRAPKRKRTKDDSRGEWQESADGTCIIKLGGNRVVREPIEIPETESSQASDPDDSQLPAPPEPPNEPSSPLHPRDDVPPLKIQDLTPSSDNQLQRECEGPAFALGIRKFIDLLSEADDLYTKTRCCDKCRDPIKRAVDGLQRNLKPITDVLERTSTHTFGENEVSATLHHDISPCKAQGQIRKRHRRVCEPDDSDAE